MGDRNRALKPLKAVYPDWRDPFKVPPSKKTKLRNRENDLLGQCPRYAQFADRRRIELLNGADPDWSEKMTDEELQKFVDRQYGSFEYWERGGRALYFLPGMSASPIAILPPGSDHFSLCVSDEALGIHSNRGLFPCPPEKLGLTPARGPGRPPKGTVASKVRLLVCQNPKLRARLQATAGKKGALGQVRDEVCSQLSPGLDSESREYKERQRSVYTALRDCRKSVFRRKSLSRRP